MYVPSAALNSNPSPLAPSAGPIFVMPAPSGDIYTSQNVKKKIKERCLNPFNIGMDLLAGGLLAWFMKNSKRLPAGSKKWLIPIFAVPPAFMGLRAIGAAGDAEWDKRKPPKTLQGARWHEVFRPSGILDLAWIGLGIATLRGNVKGLTGDFLSVFSSLENFIFLLGLPAFSMFSRYKEGQDKFHASGRG